MLVDRLALDPVRRQAPDERKGPSPSVQLLLREAARTPCRSGLAKPVASHFGIAWYFAEAARHASLISGGDLVVLCNIVAMRSCSIRSPSLPGSPSYLNEISASGTLERVGNVPQLDGGGLQMVDGRAYWIAYEEAGDTTVPALYAATPGGGAPVRLRSRTTWASFPSSRGEVSCSGRQERPGSIRSSWFSAS